MPQGSQAAYTITEEGRMLRKSGHEHREGYKAQARSASTETKIFVDSRRWPEGQFANMLWLEGLLATNLGR